MITTIVAGVVGYLVGTHAVTAVRGDQTTDNAQRIGGIVGAVALVLLARKF